MDIHLLGPYGRYGKIKIQLNFGKNRIKILMNFDIIQKTKDLQNKFLF